MGRAVDCAATFSRPSVSAYSLGSLESNLVWAETLRSAFRQFAFADFVLIEKNCLFPISRPMAAFQTMRLYLSQSHTAINLQQITIKLKKKKKKKKQKETTQTMKFKPKIWLKNKKIGRIDRAFTFHMDAKFFLDQQRSSAYFHQVWPRRFATFLAHYHHTTCSIFVWKVVDTIR